MQQVHSNVSLFSFGYSQNMSPYHCFLFFLIGFDLNLPLDEYGAVDFDFVQNLPGDFDFVHTSLIFFGKAVAIIFNVLAFSLFL
jgi:hypothetical protein